MPTSVVRTYLELRSLDQLHDAPAPPGAEVRREQCTVRLYRHLYATVGAAYHWRDRDSWDDDRMRAHLASPGVQVWLLRQDGKLAGYFELVKQDDGSVEIAYVGLVESFIGRGLGKFLLTCAAREAFALGASRVWLHTCTLDHPSALPNYLARGFQEYRSETYSVE